RITSLESQLVRLPLTRSLPAVGQSGSRPEFLHVLLVYLDTDAGHRGLGFVASMQGGGRAMKALADHDLAPLVAGEDPLDHERIGIKVHQRLPGIGGGILSQAYSAVDLALWDLKGKVAGLPIFKLLGGARQAAPAFVGETGWLGMSATDIVQATRPYLDKGLKGLKVEV